MAFVLLGGLANLLMAQSQTFTSSGTWTVPTNVYKITIEAIGGGGAGGFVEGKSDADYTVSGGGGGGSKGGVAYQWHTGGYGHAGVVRISYTVAACDLTPGEISQSAWNCSSTPIVTLTNITAATGTGVCNYSWQSSTDGNNWTTMSGTSETNTTNNSGYYRRVYSRSGCDLVYTNVVHVIHPDEADYGIVTVDGKTDTNVCTGSSVTLDLTENTSYNVTWQMSDDNGSTWSNITSPYTLTVNQYYKIRYMADYSSTCKRTSANIYSVNAKDKPVVNSITTPTDLCPGQTSYPLTASPTSSGTITEYTWTGATGTNANATVSATTPNCGSKYDYSLKVKDGFGCESDVKNGSFTTLSPTVTFSTVPEQSATLVGSNCVVPNLEAVIKSAASSTCSNPVVSYTCNPTEGSIVPDGTTWLPGYAGNNPGSGFNAKGSGFYNNDIDRYENILSQTDFWTVSTGAIVQNGVCSEITHTCPQSITKTYDKGRGFSVRCVKRAN